jgi:hypothetical protein
LDLLFGALVSTNITEALFFSRKYPEHTRRLLFEKLVSSVLLEESLGGARSKELVGLPLDSFEETWFQEYLTNGEGSRLKLAASTVETRQIITGRHRGQIRIRGLEENGPVAKTGRSVRAGRWLVHLSYVLPGPCTPSVCMTIDVFRLRTSHPSPTRAYSWDGRGSTLPGMSIRIYVVPFAR